ncbi:MAG TPA: hypothetical protein VFP39_15135 [Gemmatimonadales bacterium]|nr:hypothetical protein [Gemmatimonadales bacterium]
MKRATLWVVVYAIAMAFVEAAVVVYLRHILAPGDPTVSTPTAGVSAIPVVEAFREAATIVMLLAVGALAGGDTWERFLWFSCAFGVWDIFYYIWLRVLIGWPASVLSWDILFLIPVPWTAPVLAPVIISLGLVLGSLWLLLMKGKGAVLRFTPWVWGLAISGGVIVLLSFMLDYRLALAGREPPSFHWLIFMAGVGVAAVAFGLGVCRLPRSPG